MPPRATSTAPLAGIGVPPPLEFTWTTWPSSSTPAVSGGNGTTIDSIVPAAWGVTPPHDGREDRDAVRAQAAG